MHDIGIVRANENKSCATHVCRKLVNFIELLINDVSAEIQEELKTTIPAGRLGKPSELSALLDYILSDEANYLTGQVISLNGGLMM